MKCKLNRNENSFAPIDDRTKFAVVIVQYAFMEWRIVLMKKEEITKLNANEWTVSTYRVCVYDVGIIICFQKSRSFNLVTGQIRIRRIQATALLFCIHFQHHFRNWLKISFSKPFNTCSGEAWHVRHQFCIYHHQIKLTKCDKRKTSQLSAFCAL